MIGKLQGNYNASKEMWNIQNYGPSSLKIKGDLLISTTLKYVKKSISQDESLYSGHHFTAVPAPIVYDPHVSGKDN
jgi:hypothetical protein